MVQTIDFDNVPICRIGEWSGLNGKATINQEVFDSVIAASQDSEIDQGRLKIGHISTLNTALGDGAPAFGWIERPRMDPDGVTLRGDIKSVPKKLAGLVGKAYKQVSVELRRNVETPSGKKYPHVLSGLALLGASAPAVKGLDDLADLYASEAPDGGPEDECTQSETMTISLGDALNASDTDPTVSDVSPVAGDDDTDSPDTPGADKEGEPTVAFLDQAREKLGLAKDATEDEILTALSENVSQGGENDAAPENPAPEARDEDPAPENHAPEGPATVTVSKAAWDDAQARLGRLEADAAAKRQAEVIETALSEGRIVPAERDTWVTALSEAPEATEALIAKLAPRVNMSEAGADVALSASEDSDEDAFNAWADRIGL